MDAPIVFFVHLRRPRSANADPYEQRDDPFYEFGSFGCTGCHSANLFHSRHAEELEGARLAFVQGGPLGFRLVFLTPPITVRERPDRCEARWAPAEMPFKYAAAPVLVHNYGPSDFPLIARFARQADRTTAEGGLSSRLRSRSRPLAVQLANEVIRIYRRQRAAAKPSAIASTYEQASPYPPPRIDRNREATFRRYLRMLARRTDLAGGVRPGEAVRPQTRTRACSAVCRPLRGVRGCH
jgi:hypothetical protein